MQRRRKQLWSICASCNLSLNIARNLGGEPRAPPFSRRSSARAESCGHLIPAELGNGVLVICVHVEFSFHAMFIALRRR